MVRNSSANDAGFPMGSSDASVVTGPLPGMMVINAGDPIESTLPLECVERFRVLQQRRDEAHVLLRSAIETREEVRLDIFRIEGQIKHWQAPRGQGGPGLTDDAPQIVAEKQKMRRKQADQARLNTAYEARAAIWQNLSALTRNIEQFVTARPDGSVARVVARDAPELKKGEDLLGAIEARRRRLRELESDLHGVRCAPWPSGVAKQKMRAEIEALAEAGPDVTGIVEHNGPIGWPLTNYRFDVYNVPAPGVVAFGQLVDPKALIAWLFKDQLIDRLSAEIDECADDNAALDAKARAEKEAEALSDILACEHAEAALIEQAQAQGLPVAYRVDCDPRAVLGFEWTAAPPPVPREDAGEAGVIRHFGP